MHEHHCCKCNTIWKHPDSCAGNDADHDCPKCGFRTWTKYEGDGLPCYVFVAEGQYRAVQLQGV